MGSIVATRTKQESLIRLLEANRQHQTLDEVAARVALDPSADKKVFERMLRLGVDKNTVATSSHAPLSILRKLARSKDRHVREHAKLNLLVRSIRKTRSTRALWRWWAHSQSDAGLDLGIQMCLATHARTPVGLLAEIGKKGESSSIREAAIDTLATIASRQGGLAPANSRTQSGTTDDA